MMWWVAIGFALFAMIVIVWGAKTAPYDDERSGS